MNSDKEGEDQNMDLEEDKEEKKVMEQYQKVCK